MAKGKIVKSNRRIIIVFAIIVGLLLLLTFRLAWIQVVRGDEYSKMALRQQTSDIPIEPKRGTIYDRNGKELASSAICYTMWANPNAIKEVYGKEDIDNISKEIAVILKKDAKDIKKDITAKQAIIRVARHLEKDVADKIKELDVYGINIVENSKRFYPLGESAAKVLGSVNDDGEGRSGLELEYDEYLNGIDGRLKTKTDMDGNTLSYGHDEYYGAENGLNLVTTLDEVLQYYAEKAVENGMKETGAKRIMCVGMDPKTGDILTMVTNPSFNPNEPTQPTSKAEREKFDQMNDQEQTDYLSKMWNNPLVSDVYEPGSTFKLITASAALEEGIATPESKYTCNQSFTVPGTDVTLHCWAPKAHGVQTLKEAVGNSCNPVHIQLALQLGKDTYYKYLDMFGVTRRTHIDLPGEAFSLIQPKEYIGPVELSTMGYGHGIAVTPIQLVTAISAIANDGVMMQPRIVKELTDSNGKVVKRFEEKIVRQVISSKTASEMCDIMEYEVAEGGGSNAYVPGYRIGGKTGTANKSVNGEYVYDTYSSFVGVAPIDDPKIVFLVVVDSPQGMNYGSVVAAPIAKEFFTNAFNYLEISPKFAEGEESSKKDYIFVPDVTNISSKSAISTLEYYGLDYEILPKQKKGDEEEFTVVDQYPKKGKKIKKHGTVYLYRE